MLLIIAVILANSGDFIKTETHATLCFPLSAKARICAQKPNNQQLVVMPGAWGTAHQEERSRFVLLCRRLVHVHLSVRESLEVHIPQRIAFFCGVSNPITTSRPCLVVVAFPEAARKSRMRPLGSANPDHFDTLLSETTRLRSCSAAAPQRLRSAWVLRQSFIPKFRAPNIPCKIVAV